MAAIQFSGAMFSSLITLVQRATPELDALVMAAMRTWRYRARVVQVGA